MIKIGQKEATMKSISDDLQAFADKRGYLGVSSYIVNDTTESK